MMDDQDLETRLRAYRPLSPPHALRARAVDAGRVAGSLAWLPAVAALLLATIFYWLAANDRARLFAQFPVTDVEDAIDLHPENQP
jgi:hypothetical protein